MKSRCIITILLTTAVLVPSLSLGRQVCPRMVVKTSNLEELEDYSLKHGLLITPFITFPRPSSRVLAAFDDFYIISSSSTDIDSCLSDSLNSFPWVEFAQPDRIHRIEYSPSSTNPGLLDTFYHPYLPDDPLFSEQWDKVITLTDWAWHLSRGEEEVVIAVLDTGADSDHEDLAGNLVEGYNFVNETTDTEDDFGHGTHVSGIAAAVIDNGKGIAGTAGLCSLMPVKVVDSTGHYSEVALAQGILYAADKGAEAVNMSLGWRDTSAVVRSAVSYAWDAGVFMCAAAGNANEERSDYPAGYDEVVSVGATTPGDSRWAFSNFGEEVQVFAPGQDIYSCSYYGGYVWHDGTSMASPQVAGLAGLLCSQDASLTNQEIRDRITRTADTIPVSLDLRINSAQALGVIACQEKESEWMVRATPVQTGSLVFELGSPVPWINLIMFDAAGRMVLERNEVNDCSRIEVSISLPTGVYFWQLGTPAGAERGRLIYLE